MNELEIIRTQLEVEQSHAAEVANACAAVFASAESAGSTGSAGSAGSTGPAAASTPSEAAALFREACVSYLVWVLARFEERDQTLAELLASRPARAIKSGPADAQPLSGLIARPGRSREALARLEAALAAGESEAACERWREFASFFNSAWAPRRAALERALAEHLDVVDLRAVCAIDADSILDERHRYARIVGQLPAGIELRPASSRAGEA